MASKNKPAKRGTKGPRLTYKTKTFSIRHKESIINKIMEALTPNERQAAGQKFLDDLANGIDGE